MAVSFAVDIKPVFTDMDVAHMRSSGVSLDDFDYMRDPTHAQNVLDKVSAGVMPPVAAASLHGRPKKSSSSGIGRPTDTSPEGVRPQLS